MRSLAFINLCAVKGPGRPTEARQIVDSASRCGYLHRATIKKLTVVLPLLLLMASTGLSADKNQPLRTARLSAEFLKCRDHVLPNPNERSYRNIAWRPSVLHGIADAQKNEKPLVVLLMNGHPLGCT
jgi:hypothetical protein